MIRQVIYKNLSMDLYSYVFLQAYNADILLPRMVNNPMSPPIVIKCSFVEGSYFRYLFGF